MHPEQGLAVLSRAARNHKVIIVSVSGGADSMLALDLACQIAVAEPQLQIIAWYLHHYETAIEVERERILLDATERARKAIGNRLSFISDKADIERIRRRLRTSWEHAAALTRRRRLRLLARRLASGGHEPAPVVTGHNFSDYLETRALRKERGIPESAMPGISYIDEITGFIRPLAALPRGDIRDLMRGNGITWYEDPANTDFRYARNRIRGRQTAESAENFPVPASPPELNPVNCREYRLPAENFANLAPSARSRVLHFAYRKLAISRRFTRNHFARAHKLPFTLPPFFAHEESHSGAEQIVFRRGLGEKLRPAEHTNRPYLRGDRVTRSVTIKTNYGHKSVAKIFSEKKLSPRQRRQTIVYLQPGSAQNADFIEYYTGAAQ